MAGALAADDYRDKLHAANHLQPTQVFDRNAVQDDADPALIPAEVEFDEVLRALAGYVTSTFVRAVKPVGP